MLFLLKPVDATADAFSGVPFPVKFSLTIWTSSLMRLSCAAFVLDGVELLCNARLSGRGRDDRF